MKQKIEYLKVKFVLGFVTLVVGLIGSSIALFQWVERTGVQHLFGGYSRYILGFGGFAAMIFGAMLINDVWILGRLLKGKYVAADHVITLFYDEVEEKKEKKNIGEEHG